MLIDIDSPSTSLTQSYSGTATFGGWLFESLVSIESVFVSIDGVPLLGNAGIHGPRPDVCTSTSVSPLPDVRVDILIDTSLLSNDIHTLSVTGTTVAGQSYSVSRQFTAAN